MDGFSRISSPPSLASFGFVHFKCTNPKTTTSQRDPEGDALSCIQFRTAIEPRGGKGVANLRGERLGSNSSRLIDVPICRVAVHTIRLLLSLSLLLMLLFLMLTPLFGGRLLYKVRIANFERVTEI